MKEAKERRGIDFLKEITENYPGDKIILVYRCAYRPEEEVIQKNKECLKRLPDQVLKSYMISGSPATWVMFNPRQANVFNLENAFWKLHSPNWRVEVVS